VLSAGEAAGYFTLTVIFPRAIIGNMERIAHAFIEEYGNGRVESEMADLRDELTARGIPVTLFVGKRLIRRQLPLTRQILVAGTIPIVHEALRQLEIPLPEPDDYPDCLAAYLHRRIWTDTVRGVIERVYADGEPFFAKPRGRLKRFTGHVFASPSDLAYLEGASRKTPVLCSSVVEWVSERRVFVLQGEIVGIRLYAGDTAVAPDEKVVAEAVSLWEASGRAHAAYAIDFGVLKSGVTALVELNDGFSIGSYGLDRAVYADFTLARWQELLGANTA
jgi:hypothetical protein